MPNDILWEVLKQMPAVAIAFAWAWTQSKRADRLEERSYEDNKEYLATLKSMETLLNLLVKGSK